VRLLTLPLPLTLREGKSGKTEKIEKKAYSLDFFQKCSIITKDIIGGLYK
jgi:hypothetical protein